MEEQSTLCLGTETGSYIELHIELTRVQGNYTSSTIESKSSPNQPLTRSRAQFLTYSSNPSTPCQNSSLMGDGAFVKLLVNRSPYSLH